ncbi:MAG: hypothetical protein LBB14_00705 [Puniceicoccales bacterium]|jgi:hypothetical protein|nr:hypothetical protein [Puniceicoccales bacterium]
MASFSGPISTSRHILPAAEAFAKIFDDSDKPVEPGNISTSLCELQGVETDFGAEQTLSGSVAFRFAVAKHAYSHGLNWFACAAMFICICVNGISTIEELFVWLDLSLDAHEPKSEELSVGDQPVPEGSAHRPELEELPAVDQPTLAEVVETPPSPPSEQSRIKYKTLSSTTKGVKRMLDAKRLEKEALEIEEANNKRLAEIEEAKKSRLAEIEGGFGALKTLLDSPTGVSPGALNVQLGQINSLLSTNEPTISRSELRESLKDYIDLFTPGNPKWITFIRFGLFSDSGELRKSSEEFLNFLPFFSMEGEFSLTDAKAILSDAKRVIETGEDITAKMEDIFRSAVEVISRSLAESDSPQKSDRKQFIKLFFSRNEKVRNCAVDFVSPEIIAENIGFFAEELSKCKDLKAMAGAVDFLSGKVGLLLPGPSFSDDERRFVMALFSACGKLGAKGFKPIDRFIFHTKLHMINLFRENPDGTIAYRDEFIKLLSNCDGILVPMLLGDEKNDEEFFSKRKEFVQHWNESYALSFVSEDREREKFTIQLPQISDPDEIDEQVKEFDGSNVADRKGKLANLIEKYLSSGNWPTCEYAYAAFRVGKVYVDRSELPLLFPLTNSDNDRIACDAGEEILRNHVFFVTSLLFTNESTNDAWEAATKIVKNEKIARSEKMPLFSGKLALNAFVADDAVITEQYIRFFLGLDADTKKVILSELDLKIKADIKGNSTGTLELFHSALNSLNGNDKTQKLVASFDAEVRKILGKDSQLITRTGTEHAGDVVTTAAGGIAGAARGILQSAVGHLGLGKKS